MDKRKRFFGTGLLIIFFTVSASSVCFAQNSGAESSAGAQASGEDTSNTIEVRTETSPSTAYVNRPWSIFIMVNHPFPFEVNVKPPRFPSSIVLERVRSETRSVRRESSPSSAETGAASGTGNPGGTVTERWTRVEFLFTPQKAGTVTIDPFEITVMDKHAVTRAINVRFRDEPQTVKRYEPRFRWQAAVPSIPGGGRGELYLELTNWDPSKDAPRNFLQGRAPRNAILVEGKPEAVQGAAAGTGTYRYAVEIIPLEGTSVILDAFSFGSDIYTLNVPAITIPVLPAINKDAAIPLPAASPATASATDITSGESTSAELPATDLPGDFFSGNAEKVFFIFRPEYKQITEQVRILWEGKFYAKALAEIRRNERESLCGPFLVPLRRGMEQALQV
ncbi:MAG: hypothetical protein FWF26_03140, partial [Treponema sp.]|nr:hypothetical protein [Treponema sp.]